VVEIIGAPFDLCGRRPGSALGPAAVRLAGLQEALEALGIETRDGGDLDAPAPISGRGDPHPAPRALATYQALAARVTAAMVRGAVPLVVGGDHSLSIGSVSAALAAFGHDLAVAWIDAHADVNTPATSPTGNLHGMALALLLSLPAGVEGPPAERWDLLAQTLLPNVRLQPGRVAWVGLREVDPGEAAAIGALPGAFPSTMQDIDRYGIEAVVQGLDRWLRASGAKAVWLSFDVDALDPILAPGTGTAVRGGLSYREGHLCAELLRENLDAPDCPYRLAGLDLVEVNPLFDSNNETARMAVEWIGSLFGKTILRGVRRLDLAAGAGQDRPLRG
jgi:arginase